MPSCPHMQPCKTVPEHVVQSPYDLLSVEEKLAASGVELFGCFQHCDVQWWLSLDLDKTITAGSHLLPLQNSIDRQCTFIIPPRCCIIACEFSMHYNQILNIPQQ